MDDRAKVIANATLDDVLAELQEWGTSRRGDPETAHYEADQHLLSAIEILSRDTEHRQIAAEIVKAFDRVPKWYA